MVMLDFPRSGHIRIYVYVQLSHKMAKHQVNCIIIIIFLSTPDPSINCTNGDIRLADGATDNEGRVEICFDNHWGALCDNGWDNNDAMVVCRQLGFDTAGMQLP